MEEGYVENALFVSAAVLWCIDYANKRQTNMHTILVPMWNKKHKGD